MISNGKMVIKVLDQKIDFPTKLPQFKSERLVFKCFEEQDVRESYECITPSLTRYLAWEKPRSLEEYAVVWQTWLRQMQKGEEYVFVIRHLQSNKFIGLVGVHQLKTQSPELGIWIREDEHSQAYGREAVYMIAKWISEHFDIEQFIYPVAEQNVASRRIAEALGGTVIEEVEKPKYLSLTYQIKVPLEVNNNLLKY